MFCCYQKKIDNNFLYKHELRWLFDFCQFYTFHVIAFLSFGSFLLQNFLIMLSLIFTEVVRAEVIQSFSLKFCFLFEIAVTGQNVSSSSSIVCRKIWNELFISLLPISRVLLQSVWSSAIGIFINVQLCISFWRSSNYFIFQKFH